MVEQVEFEGAEVGVIALDVSLDEYLEIYAAQHCEWVEGVVIRMSPAGLKHNELLNYLYSFFRYYFKLRPIGKVISQPFPVHLPAFPRRCREPDLMIVLNASAAEVRDTFVEGIPEICIEIVSPESGERDHGEKFIEYETGGVPEYWVLDPIRRDSRFYRLNNNKVYVPQPVDRQGNYRTPALPELVIHIPTLWEDELPDAETMVSAIKQMLGN